MNLLARGDDPLGNDVTLHDPPKDIHKYGSDTWVTVQNFERFCYLLFICASSYIQEVCGASFMKLRGSVHERKEGRMGEREVWREGGVEGKKGSRRE